MNASIYITKVDWDFRTIREIINLEIEGLSKYEEVEKFLDGKDFIDWLTDEDFEKLTTVIGQNFSFLVSDDYVARFEKVVADYKAKQKIDSEALLKFIAEEESKVETEEVQEC